jgi:predicted glycoside hydrolase/deacetylase ChbG (UPF0249 family)
MRLIVNADDFGYFDGVSRGILHCAKAGVVTATGVMANGPAFDRYAAELSTIPSVSTGVHLNVTLGDPLTDGMRDALRGKPFPSKARLTDWLLRGRLSAATVVHEWTAQIERCVAAGLTLRFLNSHEHVHVLPPLFRGVLQLARDFRVPHVRRPRAEWGPSWDAASLARNVAFTLTRSVLPRARAREPLLIGVNRSGRLDMQYLRWRLATLRPATYELMCHPGWSDPAAMEHPKLAAYHDWELELRTLTSAEFSRLLRARAIALVSYADLSPAVGR